MAFGPLGRVIVPAGRAGNPDLISLLREAEYYADHVLHDMPDHPDPQVAREPRVPQTGLRKMRATR